jgi:hypothetical protein
LPKKMSRRKPARGRRAAERRQRGTFMLVMGNG